MISAYRLINWRGSHFSHIWTIHLYWVKMLKLLLGLLYFFRFHFVFLFLKSYVRWEVCPLASYLHVFCFQSERWVKSLRTGEVKKMLGLGWGYFCWGRGSVPPWHTMDKRFIKNWRPVSLLNVDLKLISKALATRLKDILPDPI